MTDFLDLLTRDDGSNPENGIVGGGDARARLNQITFECLTSGLSDGRVASLLRALGFDGDFACFAIAGKPAATVQATVQQVNRKVIDLGGDAPLIGVRDGEVAALIAVKAAVRPEVTCTAVSDCFDTDAAPLCLGPVRHGVPGAAATLTAALTTLRASAALAPIRTHASSVAAAGDTAASGNETADGGADVKTAKKAFPPSRRPAVPLRAEDALPERALLGDEDARRELVEVVYASLAGDNQDDTTMLTVSTFLASGGSLETTARTLNVHPNTVRYRLKRAADTTGWDATNPREAYVLTTAIALGRISAASH
ncbi:PucR family transcriptional regulator [Bifidobacterium aesculapii]|uniref:PucR family transcriptional regulator n=1 Tax=Bifidobacterium aesculapii TaxID=1329411 RepID=UPI0006E2DEFD|nr:helix-turn-helix domain-containing protein [Bifidobacterium aesculapii]